MGQKLWKKCHIPLVGSNEANYPSREQDELLKNHDEKL